MSKRAVIASVIIACFVVAGAIVGVNLYLRNAEEEDIAYSVDITGVWYSDGTPMDILTIKSDHSYKNQQGSGKYQFDGHVLTLDGTTDMNLTTKNSYSYTLTCDGVTYYKTVEEATRIRLNKESMAVDSEYANRLTPGILKTGSWTSDKNEVTFGQNFICVNDVQYHWDILKIGVYEPGGPVVVDFTLEGDTGSISLIEKEDRCVFSSALLAKVCNLPKNATFVQFMTDDLRDATWDGPCGADQGTDVDLEDIPGIDNYLGT